MVKIRMTGTKYELERALSQFREAEGIHIYSESDYYKNRGATEYYRKYLECEFDNDEYKRIPDRRLTSIQ